MLVRRRYYFWLIKAYVKRWKKTVITSVLFGVIIFFLFSLFLNFYLQPILQKKVLKVGYAGVYTLETIPEEILYDVSYGLTKRNSDGSIVPAAAEKWEIQNNGKEYVITLKRGQNFHNGDELSSENLPIVFKDVKKEIVGPYSVKYTLSNVYSPFLSSLSRPILNEKLDGLGEYRLVETDVNAGFIRSLTLQKKNDRSQKKIIVFYPTQKALKTAFMLGDVDRVVGVKDLEPPEAQNGVNTLFAAFASDKSKKLSAWNAVGSEKAVHYGELLTLFYNNADSELSNKKLRQALDYALPSSFEQGERAFSPVPPTSAYFSQAPNYGIADKEVAKTVLSSAEAGLDKPLEISTTEDYEEMAKIIVSSWKEIGVEAKIKIVNEVPSDFQILLHPIKLPKDPDQYTLWHSGQPNNIAHYRNLRIDKLLEDGRSEVDVDKRKIIYADFQKYLIDDVPASFIYFPYVYTLSR